MNFTQDDTANMIARDRIASQLCLFAFDHLQGSSWEASIDCHIQKLVYLDGKFRKTLVEDSQKFLFDQNYNEVENKKYDPAKEKEMHKAACKLIDQLFVMARYVESAREHIIATEVESV